MEWDKEPSIPPEVLREILDSTPTPFVVVSSSGLIGLLNRATEVLFGYERNALVGRQVEVLIPARLREAHIADRHNFMMQTEPRPMGVGRDLWGVRFDGTEFPVEVGLNPVDSAGGRFVVASIVDITERVERQRELAMYAANLEQVNSALSTQTCELERSNRDLEAFVRATSHDLRTPLHNIRCLASWVLDDSNTVLSAESANDLQRAVDRVGLAERLLNDLRDYSILARHGAKAEAVELDLLVERISAEVVSPAGFEIAVDGPLPRIWSPASAIECVLTHIISNAVQHHDRDHGTIRVRAVDVEHYWEIAVRDDGPGIPLEYHDRVFEMFQSLQPRDVTQSSGIGLASVRRILHAVGGGIHLESDGERGSEFRVIWPKPHLE